MDSSAPVPAVRADRTTRHPSKPLGSRVIAFLPRAAGVVALSSVLLVGAVPAASATDGLTQATGGLLQTTNGLTQVTDGLVQTVTESPSRYVVRYVPGTDVPAAAEVLRGLGITVERDFSQAVTAAVVTITPTQARVLDALPVVEAVDPDAVMQTTATQQPAPWGLDRVDQRALPLSGSYTTTSTGSGVTAYVVDSGILGSHTEFAGRVAQGWSAISDGRGTTDCNGHGTHVAGTIAGKTYGLAKATTVVPVRVFGCSGSGYMSDVIAGLDWVAGNHVAGAPAVVNLSLGGGANSTVDAAVQGVIKDGVTAVVSAGNSSADSCGASPARVAPALTVAASDSADKQASFSNTGTCVDLYAPGVSIMSATYTSNTATASMSGTSMAAPHVAGAAALLLSTTPSMTPAQVTTAVINAATTGVITGAGAGTPNRLLFAGSTAAPAPVPAPAPAPKPATATPAPAPAPKPSTTPAPAPAPAAKAPSAPTSVKATALDAAASLTWTKGTDGGSALTGQTITVFSGTQTVRTVAVAAGATSTKITGLTAGQSYSFTVTATNKVGSSPASAKSDLVRPTVAAKAPAAPTAVKAVAGSKSATVSWTKGSDGGSALTGNTITAYSGTQKIGSVNVSPTATNVRVTGLAAGKSYSFTVTATNGVGSSPASVKSNAVTATA